MKYKLREKRKRNEGLLKFAQEHPDWTQEAIAGIFHIDPSRVSRIIKKMRETVKE